MGEFNLEYVIKVLDKEEDRLFEKLNANIPKDLQEDFKAYEAIRTSLIGFRDELNKLKW